MRNLCLFAVAEKCDLYDGWEPDADCVDKGGKGCAEFERLKALIKENLPETLGAV